MSKTINKEKISNQSQVAIAINQISEKAIVSPKLFIWLPVFIAFALITMVAVSSITGNFTKE